MEYMKLSFTIQPVVMYVDMLTFHLSEIGFDMFEERADGIDAFCLKENFNEEHLKEVIDLIAENGCEIRYVTEDVPFQNWNEVWESNFEPQLIANKIYVRAEFHQENPDYPFEIIIQPRMSFGTGHHPTTSLMMELMLETNFENKSVLDMGSGTGILSILAKKLGANKVTGIDIDPIATENAIYNASINQQQHLDFYTGIGNYMEGNQFDIVLANINRNIILNDLPLYKDYTQTGGELFVSGFYLQDLQKIKEVAEQNLFDLKLHRELNNWCCACFTKIN